MNPPPIYLDNNATTRPLPEVVSRMAVAQERFPANPASGHEPGRRARRALEELRSEVGRLLGATAKGDRGDDRVVFTSGGTEANCLAVVGLAIGSLGGWSQYHRARELGARVAISTIEHPSVAAAAGQLAHLGWHVDRLPVTRQGALDLDRAKEILSPQTRLVSVMTASNETGVIQPIAELAAYCREQGVLLHTDAVQGVAKLDLPFAPLGADAMSLSAHKFNGPRGVGALVRRAGVPLAPLLFGGHQQEGDRPGTESLPLAEGLRTALAAWTENAAEWRARLIELRDSFEAELARLCPECVVSGQAAPRGPQVTNVAFPGVDRQALFMALDLAGVACSAGSACASGSNEPSPVLLAMGLPANLVGSALRFSFGITNTPEEAVRAAACIAQCVERAGGKKGSK